MKKIQPIDVIPVTFLLIVFFVWGASMYLSFA